MWKSELKPLPASQISHIPIENLKFALNLRQSGKLKLKNELISDVTALISKQEQKDSNLIIRDNGCRNSYCLQNAQDILNTQEEVRIQCL
jgi:hypothetical protein